MLTKRASRLLRQLKKVQINLAGEIIIDWQAFTAATYDTPENKRKTVQLDKKNAEAALEELLKTDCIQCEVNVYTYCKVNSTGWDYSKQTAKAVLKEVLRSVLCPFIVAVLTTLALRLLGL